MAFIDLTGQTFGKLTVLAFVGKGKKGEFRWLCKCSCNLTPVKTVAAYRLLNGNTKTCGCGRRERLVRHGLTCAPGALKISPASTYQRWKAMINRCLTAPQGSETWQQYAGRGIKICDRWLVFANFAADMGEPPDGMQLDRKDVNGDYCLENCHWVTPRQNNRNRRNNHLLTFNGVTKPLVAWSEEYGIRWNTLWYRLKSGCEIEEALKRPVKYNRKK